MNINELIAIVKKKITNQIIIEYIKKHSIYPSIINNFKKKNNYNFRNNSKFKYLSQFIIDMTVAANFTFIDKNLLDLNCEHFMKLNVNSPIAKTSYCHQVIKGFFIAEIFNTIIDKKYKNLLNALRIQPKIMESIILKLYQLNDNEPITSNWKGRNYYFDNIVNMPFVLYNEGISIEHYQTLHNKLGKHSEFNALIHGSPMASHGLMYDGWVEIQKLIEM